jgi:hypothetical protein
MDKRFISLIVLTIWCLCSAALAAGGGPNPVLTGTVNIVLANPNGIVVLTDSNQSGKLPSGEPFTSPQPGQKLFRIDDETVCTIAGFGSTTLPNFPAFTSSAAGILDRYVATLRSKGGAHSFHEKLTSLYFLIQFQLDGIGNLQHLDQTQAGDYGFELILAGYDLDGTAKIGKIVLGGSTSPNGIFLLVLQQLTERAVGRELVYEKAGIGGAAVENILDYPAQFADEPEIAMYATAKASNRGSSLTTVEMEALAKSLSHHSALINCHNLSFRKIWCPVGGRDQIATLEKGSIKKIDQQSFEQRSVNLTPFEMMIGITVDGRPRPGVSNAPAIISKVTKGNVALFLKMGLFGSIWLDNGYYFDDDFRDGTLYYYGGLLGFDSSNRVTNCRLVLGPRVDKESPAVQALIKAFDLPEAGKPPVR